MGGGMGSRCACVSMGGGPMPPTGSGSGPMPPTGSGPNPPTGSGSGSGPQPPTGSGATKKVVPWFLGMKPLEFCVETGTEVVFNKTGHNVDPWIEKMDSDGIYYFACGVGTHCSAGGMKAK